MLTSERDSFCPPFHQTGAPGLASAFWPLRSTRGGVCIGVEFKSTHATSAKFHASHGGMKLLQLPRHQSTLRSKHPPARAPLYTRPTTAPLPSQVSPPYSDEA
jgi:hypothetical protein